VLLHGTVDQRFNVVGANGSTSIYGELSIPYRLDSAKSTSSTLLYSECRCGAWLGRLRGSALPYSLMGRSRPEPWCSLHSISSSHQRSIERTNVAKHENYGDSALSLLPEFEPLNFQQVLVKVYECMLLCERSGKSKLLSGYIQVID